MVSYDGRWSGFQLVGLQGVVDQLKGRELVGDVEEEEAEEREVVEEQVEE